ncbi:helix-turn-helix transcriptional regulator [Streptococcus equi]|uniref:helix-turn-helix transcriptional regulator n=1 Tax=Streptococcus equi TaxID=1336 RepID=UPI0010C31DDE|nr:transcriptional regulator [Streptococcus equi subsp. zooepidemicus]
MTRQTLNRIKELRKEAGLSQQELADQLGIMRQTISNWERGINSLRPENSERLARVFKVSVGYLLGMTTDKSDYGLLSKKN